MSAVAILLLIAADSSATETATSSLRAGIAALDKGRYKNALKNFKRVVELAPEAESGYKGLTKTYMLMKKPHKALTSLMGAVTNAADASSDTAAAVSDLLAQENRWDEANCFQLCVVFFFSFMGLLV